MKNLKILFIVLMAASTLCCSMSMPGKTTIYIVRHAEKDTSDPKDQDPELNAEGRDRAIALAQKLKNEKLDGVFSTKFKRCNQTLTQAALNNDLEIQIYEAHDFKGIAELINTKYKNRKVLIAGHSNTVLELLEAFKVERPLAALKDDDYDLFFEISIDKTGKADVRTERYGKAHHSTMLK